jgi:hypothetical protein
MFVERDNDSKINGSYHSRQYEGQEEVADSAPELVAFLDAVAGPKTAQITTAQVVRALAQAVGKTDRK